MRKPKVYCAFQYFNEKEILKIKLEELWDVVDGFIIEESTHTHSGIEKPFHLFTHQYPEFSKYCKKMIHCLTVDTPSNMDELLAIEPDNYLHAKAIDAVKNAYWFDKNVESYLRDTYEKECLIRYMEFLKDDDIVILGDCDEIPKATKLKEIIENISDGEIYHMQHDFYWYYLNILKNDELWYGNMVMKFKTFKEKSFCELRQNKQGMRIGTHSGWHFTYMGGVERVKTKIESWGEQSLNVTPVKNHLRSNIENALELGRDIFFRPAKFIQVPIDYETHPLYLVEHQEEYKDFIL